MAQAWSRWQCGFRGSLREQKRSACFSWRCARRKWGACFVLSGFAHCACWHVQPCTCARHTPRVSPGGGGRRETRHTLPMWRVWREMWEVRCLADDGMWGRWWGEVPTIAPGADGKLFFCGGHCAGPLVDKSSRNCRNLCQLMRWPLANSMLRSAPARSEVRADDLADAVLKFVYCCMA